MSDDKKTILVIDDEPGIREYLRFVLESAGYAVLEAVDGESGLKAMVNECVHVVITDLVMPGKEGIETIVSLRKHFKTTKIIAMSGVGNKDTYLTMAETLGADFAISKPFSRTDVLAAIEAVTAS